MSDAITSDKSITPPATFAIGARVIPLEMFCTYKVTTLLELLSKAADELKIQEIVPLFLKITREDDGALGLAASLLPKLMTQAPDVLIRAVAVGIIPNHELLPLFKQGAGAISARVSEEVEFLTFNASATEVIELASALIPMLGIDALKNALARLVVEATNSLANHRAP